MKLPFYVRWLLKVSPATKSSYDIIGLCFANFILQFCLKTKNTLVVLEKLPFSTLHKKWSSLWRISSVNVTKSAGNFMLIMKAFMNGSCNFARFMEYIKHRTISDLPRSCPTLLINFCSLVCKCYLWEDSHIKVQPIFGKLYFKSFSN